VGDAVTWGSKIYTLGDPRCIRSLRGLPGASLSGTLVSYGASAVTRTSGRGHVAEA